MGWHRPHPSWDERHIHIVQQPWAHGGFEDQANAIVCSRSHGEAPSCETLANAHQGIYREIHNLNGSKLWETSTFNKKRKITLKNMTNATAPPICLHLNLVKITARIILQISWEHKAYMYN